MRVVLAGFCLAASLGVASAQETPPPPAVLDQVYACANVAGETERLACYDAAVGNLRAAQQSGDLVAVDRGQAATLRRESFGFSLPSLPRMFGDNEDNPEFAAQQMTVERVTGSTFRMSNGQVWSQVDSAPSRAVRPGGTVTIRSAAMGSFLMSVDAGGPALRVRRTQ